MQKPDQRIFKLSEKKAAVRGEKILFIDNVKKNRDSTAKYGWQMFLYDSTNYEEASRKLAFILPSY